MSAAAAAVIGWAAMAAIDVPECAYMEGGSIECHVAAVGELKAAPAHPGRGPWPLCERHLQRLARLVPRQRERLVRW